nr:hypothetical protein [Desulfobacula sp.]
MIPENKGQNLVLVRILILILSYCAVPAKLADPKPLSKTTDHQATEKVEPPFRKKKMATTASIGDVSLKNIVFPGCLWRLQAYMNPCYRCASLNHLDK